MAVAITKTSPNADFVLGNKKCKVRDLVFSGNYATLGESITAASVGLRKIQFVLFSGPVRSTDVLTSAVPTFDYTNSKVLVYESGASGAALIEKTDAEAYATGSNVRAVFVGY